MFTSRDRILTTHVGSLPRNETITELLIKREAGETIDPKKMSDELDRAVADVVKRQKDAGIDVGNDGEQQRVAFQTYMAARMSGYGGESKRRVGKDFVEHPDLVATFGRRFVHRAKISNAPQAIADVKYTDTGPIKDEIARFKKHASNAFAEQFMTAPSPGIVATTLMNAHYDLHEAYVNALAVQLRKEYLAIHEAGLILQVDAPDLAMERVMTFQDESDAQFVKVAEMQLAAINKACEGIPADRWRLHICWGNWEGPHVYDIALAKVLPVFYQATAGALSIEFANPRHQHEYAAFKAHPFPQDKILIPGVIESTSNFVEHPEVVARRIEEAVAAIGDRERVIASTDCGFGTFAGREWVAASIVWPKLKTLREGADLASQRLRARRSPDCYNFMCHVRGKVKKQGLAVGHGDKALGLGDHVIEEVADVDRLYAVDQQRSGRVVALMVGHVAGEAVEAVEALVAWMLAAEHAEMPLADQRGVVAKPLDALGQCDHGAWRLWPRAVDLVAVAATVLVLARQEGGARLNADRC